MKYQVKSAKDTYELGKNFGSVLKQGKTFLLVGELGSGKTQFVKGLATGLRIKEPIISPTFTFERVYENKKGLSLHHFDLYRSDKLDPDIALLIQESISEGNVVAIEWAERAKGIWPKHYILLKFDWKSESEREIEVSEK